MPSYDVLVDFWCSHLRQRSFATGAHTSDNCAHCCPLRAPDPAYEMKVAKFLAKNELTRPSQLKHAEHPQEWLGADEFNIEELEAIRELQIVPASMIG